MSPARDTLTDYRIVRLCNREADTVNEDFTWTEAILAPIVLLMWAVILVYILPLMVSVQ